MIHLIPAALKVGAVNAVRALGSKGLQTLGTKGISALSALAPSATTGGLAKATLGAGALGTLSSEGGRNAVSDFLTNVGDTWRANDVLMHQNGTSTDIGSAPDPTVTIESLIGTNGTSNDIGSFNALVPTKKTSKSASTSNEVLKVEDTPQSNSLSWLNGLIPLLAAGAIGYKLGR